MVDIEEAVYALLTGDATLSALVSTRIYPRHAPQGAARPYVTYTLIASPGHHHQSSTALVASPTFQFGIHADTRAARQRTEAALVGAFDAYAGSVAGVAIQRATRTGRRHSFVPAGAGSQQGDHYGSVDFTVWHTET